MKIRVLGGGWYGCHIACDLIAAGHEVELWELAERLFSGASGGNPARLHLGFHYPRSRLTRAMCQETHERFMAVYGELTRTIPTNVYAVAADDSLVDFGTYRQVLRGEVEFVTLERPAEIGLEHVEGAILTGERHILINAARAHFEALLGAHVRYGVAQPEPGELQGPGVDWTIDCTFCALDGLRIDRYEPCVTALVKGPTDKAVTIMDGPFPSLYPWDEWHELSSLTSAKWTPLAACASYAEAAARLKSATAAEIDARAEAMRAQLRHFWPASWDLYELSDVKLTIRAMPLSGSAARLVDVVRVGPRNIRIRAGKIDAILHAATLVREVLCCA